MPVHLQYPRNASCIAQIAALRRRFYVDPRIILSFDLTGATAGHCRIYSAGASRNAAFAVAPPEMAR
jgi:hypothetical protein